MSKKFDVLGIELEWKLQRSDTQGRYCVMTATMPPGSGVPPHQHPQQEAFFILDGEAEFAVGDSLRWQKVHAGDMVNIPHDAVHGFRNVSDRSVSVLLTCEGDLGNFFEEAGTPLADNETPTQPTPEAIGRVLDIAKKHGQRFPEIP